jgi:cell division protein FtsL
VTPRRPRTPARRRGRSIVASALVGFVLVAAAVIWRRGSGVAHGNELRGLDRQRLQLEAQKAALDREIQDLGSRARLGPVAEQRLDMHVPADSQVIVLPAPSIAPTAASPTDGAERHASP